MNLRYLLFFLFLIFALSCGKKKPGVKARLSSITESVYASGKVKAQGQYQVLPVVNGLLRQVLVEPGDSVKEGQILFSVENSAIGLNTESARLALDLSETNNQSGSDRLKELEENLDLAKEKYELDSSLFLRQNNLFAQQVGSKNDVDQRKLALQSSRTAYLTARNRLNQIRIQLANELERARVGYRLSQAQAGDFQVKARKEGLVFDVLRTEGELVSPQTPLAVIGNPENWSIELQVSENDISRVEPGQVVDLVLDGYPNQVFQARLIRIYPILNERTRNFRVDAVFQTQPGRLFPNLNLEANIRIRNRENVLVLPRRYLMEGNKVMLQDGTVREVKTGLKDYEKIEIVSGIDSSDVVVLP
jgi:multidrug resistance efflux pump